MDRKTYVLAVIGSFAVAGTLAVAACVLLAALLP